jgi:Asp-tRNA(Asn)/Glu-tRNA(Gln) amidotransferase A subunit family amidase
MEQSAEARASRAAANTAARAVFDGIDVLLTPTVGAMRKVIGDDDMVVGDTVHHYRSVLSCFTALVNHLRSPALVMPLNVEGSPPPSLQVIGPRWSEPQLLEFGRQLERAEIVAFRPPGA